MKAEEALKKWEDGADSSKGIIFRVYLTFRTTRNLILCSFDLVEPKVVKTPLEKWELSLHACTNFSQLYVHLALLGMFQLSYYRHDDKLITCSNVQITVLLGIGRP